MNIQYGDKRRLENYRLHQSVHEQIAIPMVIAAVPALLFLLLGLITKGMDLPGAKLSFVRIVLMCLVQTAGIVAMALVALRRFGLGVDMLRTPMAGSINPRRMFALTSSIVSLVLFDLLTNIAAAFAGAGFLCVGAVPAFLVYLVSNRIAFQGLCRPNDHFGV